MKRKDFHHAFKQVKPDDEAKQRMFSNIKKEGTKQFFNFRSALPVLITALILVTVGIVSHHFLTMHDVANNDDMVQEDGAEIRDEFQIDDKHYVILSEDDITSFGFPTAIDDHDIGDKLTTITTSIDERLLGKDVFQYLPAESEAVVAVNTSEGYTLFGFYNFDSYLENQDEDTQAYLELYGIDKAADIEKIQLIGQQDMGNAEDSPDVISEITSQKDIDTFYDYYARLENASDEYFDRLSHGGHGETEKDASTEDATENRATSDKTVSQNNDVPAENSDSEGGSSVEQDDPDHDSLNEHPASNSDMQQRKGEQNDKEQSSPAYEGTGPDALADSVNIRIYQNSGVYYETVYYPRIKFISRHEVSEGFANFLETYIN